MEQKVDKNKKEGDKKTPEGDYILDYKKSDSSYYKSIHISYPNKQDKLKAKKLAALYIKNFEQYCDTPEGLALVPAGPQL